MKLSATHVFNCIVLMLQFGQTSCEDIPPALLIVHKGVIWWYCVLPSEDNGWLQLVVLHTFRDEILKEVHEGISEDNQRPFTS